MRIVNDDSMVINKLEASPTDDARVVSYDHHMFIVQATGVIFTALQFLRKLQMDKLKRLSKARLSSLKQCSALAY